MVYEHKYLLTTFCNGSRKWLYAYMSSKLWLDSVVIWKWKAFYWIQLIYIMSFPAIAKSDAQVGFWIKDNDLHLAAFAVWRVFTKNDIRSKGFHAALKCQNYLLASPHTCDRSSTFQFHESNNISEVQQYFALYNACGLAIPYLASKKLKWRDFTDRSWSWRT